MVYNINRLAGLLLLGFLVVTLGLVYWQVMRAPELMARPYNPRPIEAERRIRRGRILDRHGVELVGTDVDMEGKALRFYRYPPLVHVTGYHSLRYGATGLEGAYNARLRGETEEVERDLLTTLVDDLLHRPQVGQDIVLTIDLELQKVADDALGERRGAIVLLDPRSGEILALASHPYYNPNTLEEEWETLRDNPQKPLINRASQGLYPPGSSFKVVTLAAVLEEGLTSPQETFIDDTGRFVVQGFPILCNNHPGHTSFDLYHAFGYSCNVAFARLGLRLGGEKLLEYARRFGLGRAPDLDIPAEGGQLAGDLSLGGTLDDVEVASTAMGQGELIVSPLQMALAAAAIANGGIVPQPLLVLQPPSSGAWHFQSARHLQGTSRAVSPRTARQVGEAMVVVVREGTGQPAGLPGVQVAGKTGTAQITNGRMGEEEEPHAWFVGFAPADAPRYAIAVLVEHGGPGSKGAAPLARLVMEAALSK